MISFNCGNISLSNTVHHYVKMCCIVFSSNPSVHFLGWEWGGGVHLKRKISQAERGEGEGVTRDPCLTLSLNCPYLLPPARHALTALAYTPSPPALQRAGLELSRPTRPAARLWHTHSPGASPGSVTDTALVAGQSRACVRSSRFLVVAWWP